MSACFCLLRCTVRKKELLVIMLRVMAVQEVFEEWRVFQQLVER